MFYDTIMSVDLDLPCLKILYRQYKYKAQKRKLEFELTISEFYTITSRQCYLCGTNPRQIFDNSQPQTYGMVPYIYNGIDRKNPSMGYILSNVEACCKECNYMKQSMTLKEFKEHILKILKALI